MYASALPAGNFRGIGAAARVVHRSPLPSRDGSRAAQHATSIALRRVGIQGLRGGLGDVDMCNDPGWRIANAFTSAAGSAMAQYGASQGDTGWSTAGGAVGAVGQAWASACVAGATGAAQPTETPADVYARAMAQTQMQAAQQRQAELSLQMQRERTAAAAQQQQTNTYLMIGGGVLAVAAVVGLVMYGRH